MLASLVHPSLTASLMLTITVLPSLTVDLVLTRIVDPPLTVGPALTNIVHAFLIFGLVLCDHHWPCVDSCYDCVQEAPSYVMTAVRPGDSLMCACRLPELRVRMSLGA